MVVFEEMVFYQWLFGFFVCDSFGRKLSPLGLKDFSSVTANSHPF